jgi:hypothetical protein
MIARLFETVKGCARFSVRARTRRCRIRLDEHGV